MRKKLILAVMFATMVTMVGCGNTLKQKDSLAEENSVSIEDSVSIEESVSEEESTEELVEESVEETTEELQDTEDEDAKGLNSINQFF